MFLDGQFQKWQKSKQIAQKKQRVHQRCEGEKMHANVRALIT